MIVLLLKEVREFFSSLTGYVAVVVFLLINSLFLWVLPGDLNIIDAGYASLDSFFTLAPWVFLFLIPAITMRMFAEEKRTGMLEFLMTKPLSDLEIILAKYLGGIFLVTISILPCLVYFWSVSVLGNPPGNIDAGAVTGAFIGLFFLAAIYVAIGILASALSENQIVSFIIAIAMCFIAYIGFDYLAQWPGLQKMDTLLLNLGINEHYKSISRGVIDSRDIVYYLVAIVLFLLLTKTRLQSCTW
jgi:ABC-2 type transport system permease protein